MRSASAVARATPAAHASGAMPSGRASTPEQTGSSLPSRFQSSNPSWTAASRRRSGLSRTHERSTIGAPIERDITSSASVTPRVRRYCWYGVLAAIIESARSVFPRAAASSSNRASNEPSVKIQ